MQTHIINMVCIYLIYARCGIRITHLLFDVIFIYTSFSTLCGTRTHNLCLFCVKPRRNSTFFARMVTMVVSVTFEKNMISWCLDANSPVNTRNVILIYTSFSTLCGAPKRRLDIWMSSLAGCNSTCLRACVTVVDNIMFKTNVISWCLDANSPVKTVMICIQSKEDGSRDQPTMCDNSPRHFVWNHHLVQRVLACESSWRHFL